MKNQVGQEGKKAKYIRISSSSQNSDRQKENDISIKLYEDVISGSIPFQERKAGKRLMKDVAAGKVNHITVAAVDRMGRNVFDIQDTIQFFVSHKVQIFVENYGMNLLDEDGEVNLIAKMILDLLGSVATMELRNIRERQTQGIQIAKAKGKYKGRKVGATMDDAKFDNRHKDALVLLKDGISINRVSKLTGKSFQTVKKVKLAYDLKINDKNISCPTTK